MRRDGSDLIVRTSGRELRFRAAPGGGTLDAWQAAIEASPSKRPNATCPPDEAAVESQHPHATVASDKAAAAAEVAREAVEKKARHEAAGAAAEALALAATDLSREFRALGGYAIKLTEERAISLVQLEAVWANIERRCKKEKWKGGRPNGTDAEGKPQWMTVALKPENVNLYDADTYVIRPLTVERRCSLVEVLAAGPQPPDWFVSHSWGESIRKFVACIKRHSVDRCLGFDMEGEPAQPGVHTTDDYYQTKFEVKAPGLYWVRSAAPPLPSAVARGSHRSSSPSAGLRVRQQPVEPGGGGDG